MANRRNTERDFWNRVDKGPGHGPNGECWIWVRAKDKDGYGKANFGNKTIRSHRLSFFFAKGYLNPDKAVCHECDFPPCVRPDHLFEGTTLENNQDKMRKGREPHEP